VRLWSCSCSMYYAIGILIVLMAFYTISTYNKTKHAAVNVDEAFGGIT